MSIFSHLRQKVALTLHKSERYVKTDMVYLVKEGGWLMIGQFISLALLFLLSVVLANLLSQETYGNYKYVLSLAGLLSALCLSGMNTAVSRAVAQQKNNSLQSAFKTQLKWGVFQFLIVLPIAYYYFINSNHALALSMLIIGSFVPLMNSANTYTGVLTGKKEFKTFTIYNTSVSIITTLSLLVTILLTSNFIWLLFIYFLSATIANLIFYQRTIKIFNIKNEEDDETLSFGKHLSLINLLPTIAYYIDGALIFHYLGAIDLAVYNFAIAMPEQIKGFLKNIMSLTFPKFSQQSIIDIKASIWKKNLYFTLGILIIIILYIVAAPTMYRIFFPKYLQSVYYSQIFVISLLAMSSMVSKTALMSQTAKKSLYKLSVIAAISQIAVTFLLILYYGILGAIISKILMRFFDMTLSAWFIKKL
ncbi:MAG: hypothetical protein COU81_03470 [Candidatus Portnoybacteria bacterium CG10_big_fil_rev_8_21_14_0_10_36_7]|uniref:Polysaccharide biosynthesis protein C-terminal domain-containing protein n=1 Tax=Candidatus Portnoybacteria bacterium CG10_big_fil_rev_8_21_14_0_10_36_7 TaxID=1974812 RepID=A0A2M8KDE6_9BACT|nr:MAG: hypothetical protein COU81_03470 [Candidatus Portnoybacteria bacterium CG10_big_fil_rev_8_21_14_0_10_36_7]